jgi:hypothetical protein
MSLDWRGLLRLILIHDWSFSDQRIGVHFFGERAESSSPFVAFCRVDIHFDHPVHPVHIQFFAPTSRSSRSLRLNPNSELTFNNTLVSFNRNGEKAGIRSNGFQLPRRKRVTDVLRTNANRPPHLKLHASDAH